MFSSKKIFFTHQNKNLKITYLGTQEEINLNKVKMEGDYSFEFSNNMQLDGNVLNIYDYLKANGWNFHPGITLLCKSENLIDPFVTTPIGNDGKITSLENVNDNNNDFLYGAAIFPGLTSSANSNGMKAIGSYRLGSRSDYRYETLNPFRTKIKIETNVSTREVDAEFNIKNPNFKIVAATDSLFWDGINQDASLELISGNATKVQPYVDSESGYTSHFVEYKIDNVNEASMEKNLRFRANGCGIFMIRHSAGVTNNRLKYRVYSSISSRNREEFSLASYSSGYHCSTTLFNGDEIIFDLETINSTEQDSVYFRFVPKNIFPLNLYDEDIKGLYPINLYYLYDLNLIEGEGSEHNSQFDLVHSPTLNSYFLKWKKNMNSFNVGDLLSIRIQCKRSSKSYGSWTHDIVLAENILQFNLKNNSTLSMPKLSFYENDKSSLQNKTSFFISYSPYENLGYLNNLEIKMPKKTYFFESNNSSGSFWYSYGYHSTANLITITEINTGEGWEEFFVDCGNYVPVYFDYPSYNSESISNMLRRAVYNNKPLSVPTCKDVQFRSYYSDGFPPSLVEKINNKVNNILLEHPEYESYIEQALKDTFCGYGLSDINKGIGNLGTSPYVYSDLINKPPLNREFCDEQNEFDPVNLFVTFE